MGFDDFESNDDETVTCIHCGTVVKRGLVNLVNHWSNCSGKGITEALVSIREQKGSPLTMADVESINSPSL